MEHFGKCLKAWREHRQMTQATLAKRLEVTPAMISQYETAVIPDPSGTRIQELCQALDVDYSILMDGIYPKDV